jgi:putative redox protein
MAVMDGLLSLLTRTCLLNVMALETRITWEDGVRFRMNARRHELVCDQPAEDGGTDEGMAPPELLLASLGACAAYYAAEYLRLRHIPSAGLTVTVSAEKAQRPARLTNFRVMLSVPALEDQRHREAILRAAKNCLIHNTLQHRPNISIELEDRIIDSDHEESARAEKH